MSEAAIEVRELTKSYGGREALRGASFRAEMGQVLGLLGPNGAGKTTTFSILCGLVAPSAGDAFINGRSVLKEPSAARSALGVVPQDIALYADLSARENLLFWGRMQGLGGVLLRERVDEVLDAVGLADRQKDKVGGFSGGMKRRVNIGAALLHHPSVVIMDEPTVGIDPQSRRHILDWVKELNHGGATVLYTTHYMEEAEELSQRIAIMAEGRVIACGSSDELLASIGEEARISLGIRGEEARPGLAKEAAVALRAVEIVTRAAVVPEGFEILALDGDLVLPRLIEAASRAGLRIASAKVEKPDLESVFLALTGRALRDGEGR
jgi:ABC-2 type transport system ATP-binding protein